VNLKYLWHFTNWRSVWVITDNTFRYS